MENKKIIGVKGRRTYSPMTRFSEEQVTMAQLQGSTESSSQLFNTPLGSFNALFILINASTTNPKNKN